VKQFAVISFESDNFDVEDKERAGRPKLIEDF